MSDRCNLFTLKMMMKNCQFADITKITVLLGHPYYSDLCDIGYNTSDRYQCLAWCDKIIMRIFLQTSNRLKCDWCDLECKSPKCLPRQREMESKSTIKMLMYFCNNYKVSLTQIMPFVEKTIPTVINWAFSKPNLKSTYEGFGQTEVTVTVIKTTKSLCE